MKKLVLVVAMFAFVASTFAQNQTKPAAAAQTAPATSKPATAPVHTAAAQTTPAASKPTANPAAFACPKCYAITKAGGMCEHCKVEKVQLGTYYCTHCMKATGDKPGKCPTCSAESTRMTRKYVAEKTGGKKEEPKKDAPKKM